VQMYTNDAKTLGQELSRDVSHPTAIQHTGIEQEIGAQKIGPHPVEMEISQGISMGR
jgi:hypothetical protein